MLSHFFPHLALFIALFFLTSTASTANEPSSTIAQAPAQVVFLNPGLSDEPFWVTYSEFMQAAADDLGVKLRVIYGERNRETLLQTAQSLAQASQLPDYIIFVNEMYTGPEILRTFANTQVKLLSLHSTLTPEQQAISGKPRGRYKNWLGSLVANDKEAGYLMAKELIQKAGNRAVTMLAFAGIRSTPSSTLREEGLQQALSEHPEVTLKQLVYGEWSEKRAYEQASLLLARYTETELIWSANDEMAFGVMKAAIEHKRSPGRDIFLSALNNSEKTLQARINGQFSVLATGHFSLGGWAMVMIHDYHHGKDFSNYGGIDQTTDLFLTVTEIQAKKLKDKLKNPKLDIDFKKFSAVYNPKIEKYTFSVSDLID